jgi:acetoin utilization protein AcuB
MTIHHAAKRSTPPTSPSRTSRISRETTMRDVMSYAPHTIGSEQKLLKAHKVMREHGVRHLPVLRGGKLVGVLSQRDLYFLESIAGVDIEIDKVADAMTPDVYVVTPDDTLRNVASVMADHRYGCAVVIGGEGGNVLGIFTVTDALKHIAEVLD